MQTQTATVPETERWISAQRAEVSRRTDDIAFNVKYLAARIVDREVGVFVVGAEGDVTEQNLSGVAESDIHKLGATVYQNLDSELGQYVSLGAGTIDHARAGIEALDDKDPDSFFEFERRTEEEFNEVRILDPKRNAGMRAGSVDVFVSPAPTHNEVDPDIAETFGYDDRTMMRFQTLSVDGQTKTMRSFTLFDAPAKAWAAYFSNEYDANIEPTAISVMRFCNTLDLQEGSIDELLKRLVNGVRAYVNEEEAENLDRQLDAFINEQIGLEEQAKYYAQEKTTFQKEVALSYKRFASPGLQHKLDSAFYNLAPEYQAQLAGRYRGEKVYVDDFVVELLLKLNTVTTANRAGLATLNERTFKRVASKVGLDVAIALADTERMIQEMSEGDSEFMKRRSEQLIVEAGLECGGGCEVAVVDLFSEEADAAKKAGLSGTLYEASSLNENSKCICKKTGKKAKVISDGKNVVCTTCGDYDVKGKRGTLKKAA